MSLENNYNLENLKVHHAHLSQQSKQPKVSKFTADENLLKRRKKNKSKLKDRSDTSASAREKDDPAFTEDVRHLAFPMRRNSGPEKNSRKYFDNFELSSGIKMSTIIKRRQHENKSKNADQSSSNENLDDSNPRRGQSLDRRWFQRNIGSQNTVPEQRSKKDGKRNDKSKIDSNLNKSMDEEFFHSPKLRKKLPKQIYSADQAGKSRSDSMTSDEIRNPKYSLDPKNQQTKKDSKMQIGKRFLKGEIGIKSFNYYLIKEGLKSTKKNILKQTSEPAARKSNSEENIYEEIYYNDNPRPTAAQSHYDIGSTSSNSLHSLNSQTVKSSASCNVCDDPKCMLENCDICKYNSDNSNLGVKTSSVPKYHHQHHQLHAGPPTTRDKMNYQKSKMNASAENVLQFQSYNPNNPGIYKIETTPVTFTSDYNPIQHIHNSVPKYLNYDMAPNQLYAKLNASDVIRAKSSSSNDSLHRHNKSDPCYHCGRNKDNIIYDDYEKVGGGRHKPNSKTSSSNELSHHKTDHRGNYGDMSDSSIGDSMFSYPVKKKYFGSSESCRYEYDCRQCDIENEKCSFSDTCRYGCKNCDCSSSYFSSDFDDSNFTRPKEPNYILDSYTSAVHSPHPSKYAADFMKHIDNVKRNNLHQTLSCQVRINEKKKDASHYQSADKQNRMTFETFKALSLEKDKKFDARGGSQNNLYATVEKKSGTLPQTGKSNRHDKRGQHSHYEEIQSGDKKYYSLKANSTEATKISNTTTVGTTNIVNKLRLENAASEEQILISELERENKSLQNSQSNSATIKQTTEKAIYSAGKQQQKHQPPTQPPAPIQNEKAMLPEGGSHEKDTIEIPQPRRRPSLKDIDWNEFDEGDDDVFISETETLPKKKKTTTVPNANNNTAQISEFNADKKSTIKNQQQSSEKVEIEVEMSKSTIIVAASKSSQQQQDNHTPLSSNNMTQSNEKNTVSSSTCITTQLQVRTADELNKGSNNINKGEFHQQQQQQISEQKKQQNQSHYAAPNQSQSTTSSSSNSNFAQDIEVGVGVVIIVDGPGSSHANKCADEEIETTKLRITSVSKIQQNNVISRDSNQVGDTSCTVRERNEQHFQSSTISKIESYQKIKETNTALDREKIEILDLPLPAIPTKKSKSSSVKQQSSCAKTTTTTQYPQSHLNNEKSSTREFFTKERESIKFTTTTKEKRFSKPDGKSQKKMHTRSNTAQEKPTYYFGENVPRGGNVERQKNEIFLNKSGYIQVNQNKSGQMAAQTTDEQNYVFATKVTTGYRPTPVRAIRVENFKHFGNNQSSMVKRDENITSTITINKFEHHKSSNFENNYKYSSYPDRPEFLPIERNSPPPPTPILSPPPAFQDTKSKRTESSVQISVTDYETRNPKGMIFSRSFEYDNRRNDVVFDKFFSNSFDYNSPGGLTVDYNTPITFSTLTGISPSYLSKRDSFEKLNPISRDSSPSKSNMIVPRKAEPLTVKNVRAEDRNDENPKISNHAKSVMQYRSLDDTVSTVHKSKKSQFSRFTRDFSDDLAANSKREYKSFDMANMRLNSCDSGARSDYSNDETDDDEDEEEDELQKLSSMALSFKSTQEILLRSPDSFRALSRHQKVNTTALSRSQNAIHHQRSLTPDRIFDNDLNSTYQNNLRKQRSLTPEKRSFTPDQIYHMTSAERRSKGHENAGDDSYASLRSDSKSHLLDRYQLHYEDDLADRSFWSSSSSSNCEEHGNSRYSRNDHGYQMRKNKEHQMRRSRSLQLSEKSSNRSVPYNFIVDVNSDNNNRNNSKVIYSEFKQQNNIYNTRNVDDHYQTPRNIPNYRSNTSLDKDNSLQFSTDGSAIDKYYNRNRINDDCGPGGAAGLQDYRNENYSTIYNKNMTPKNDHIVDYASTKDKKKYPFETVYDVIKRIPENRGGNHQEKHKTLGGKIQNSAAPPHRKEMMQFYQDQSSLDSDFEPSGITNYGYEDERKSYYDKQNRIDANNFNDKLHIRKTMIPPPGNPGDNGSFKANVWPYNYGNSDSLSGSDEFNRKLSDNQRKHISNLYYADDDNAPAPAPTGSDGVKGNFEIKRNNLKCDSGEGGGHILSADKIDNNIMAGSNVVYNNSESENIRKLRKILNEFGLSKNTKRRRNSSNTGSSVECQKHIKDQSVHTPIGVTMERKLVADNTCSITCQPVSQCTDCIISGNDEQFKSLSLPKSFLGKSLSQPCSTRPNIHIQSMELPKNRLRRFNSASEIGSSNFKTGFQHKNNIDLYKLIKSSGVDLNLQDNAQQDGFFGPKKIECYAKVVYEFEPAGEHELHLRKGDIINVLCRESGLWWWGELNLDVQTTTTPKLTPDHGWFPKEYVEVISELDNGFNLSNNRNCHTLPIKNKLNVIKRPIREKITKELLDTEIIYVNLLSALCNGFINKMQERCDIFSSNNITIIFMNIEKIWKLQQNFLESLRTAIKRNKIAECFIKHQSEFLIYSTYCNCFPRALTELQNITKSKEVSRFLEKCRVNENLPDLPLSAHLLAPIQRICRYPLHLSEMIEHSLSSPLPVKSKVLINEIENTDCKEMFEKALNSMKHVLEVINEGKRQSEYLAELQSRFDQFHGLPINFSSSHLFLQIDASFVYIEISNHATPSFGKTSQTLFLFDHQLIQCKKFKKTNYSYKGRINLDNCRVLNLPDTKIFGVSLKNALQIFCNSYQKWFCFSFRSKSSKLRFLEALTSEQQFCGSSLFITEIEQRNDATQVFLESNSIGNYYNIPATNVEDSGCSFEIPEMEKEQILMTYNTLPKRSQQKLRKL